MKKLLSGLLAMALTAAVTVGIIPLQQGAVYAAENPDAWEELARQLQDTTKDPFAYGTGEDVVLLQEAESMPSSFDLRNVDSDGDGIADANYITPVKFQNPFGTCWGFAAIAAAETSILGNDELLYKDGEPIYSTSLKQGEDGKPVLDLSEKHLVNYIVQPINDPDNSQNGEGMYYADQNLTLEEKLNHGGVPFYATSLFSSGMGPVLESRDMSAEGYASDIFVYHGANAFRTVAKINDLWIDYCYDQDDDWSLPEALRFKQSYVLKESYMLPSPADQGTASEPKYTYNPDGTAAIKAQLFNRRAVEIGFHADTSRPNQDRDIDGEYISRNWAHYTDSPEYANHAVTIVGWDDEYPATNFIEGREPRNENGELANGAWLVKNSWGSGEEVFPNYGDGSWGIPVQKTDENGDSVVDENGDPVMVGSGYFWLSYYDQSLSMPEALAFDESNVGSSYYLDQYDFMPVTNVTTAALPMEIYSANVFKADVNEELRQISCLTTAPGTRVQYEIYLLANGFSDPMQGVCVAQGTTEPFEFGGFHKIMLADPVLVQKGQSYSVIITQLDPEGNYCFNMPFGYNEILAPYFGMENWLKGVINPKESYVYCEGEWVDYSDPEFLEQKLIGPMYMTMAFDNFPIKGYCRERKDTVNLYCANGSTIILAPAGEESTQELRLRFKGQAANMPANPQIIWQIAEGSEKLLQLTENEKDSSRATVSAIASGTGYVIASCEDVGTLVIPVNVSKEGKIFTYGYTLPYGYTQPIDVEDYDGSIPDPATLTFVSSNEKVATVSKKGIIKAVGVGEANITITDPTGAEAVCEVEVVKAENTIQAKGKTVSLKAAALKKKAQTVKRSKAIAVSKAQGSATYKLVSVTQGKFKKYFKVNAKTGAITVKKGLKKGTYKLKVSVNAAGNKNYRKLTKRVTVNVKVK